MLELQGHFGAIPEHISFNDLALSIEPTRNIILDMTIFKSILKHNDIAFIENDHTSRVMALHFIAAWYKAHLNKNGNPSKDGEFICECLEKGDCYFYIRDLAY